VSLRMRSSLGFLAILTVVIALALLYPANVSAAAPSDLRASLDNSLQVVLSWTPGTNPNYVRQVIMRRQSGTATGERGEDTFQPAQWVEVATLPSGARTYTDSGVSEGKRYSYRVRAEKANGKSSISRLVWIKVRVKSSPPTGLTASVQGGNVVLSWTPGTNPDYVRQIVLRRQKGGAWVRVHTMTDTSLATWTDGSTTPDQRYIYRVRAEKANNKGGLSPKVTVQR